MRWSARCLIFLLVFSSLSGLRAEVKSASESGFMVETVVELSAGSDRVYKTILQPWSWWSSRHSFSGDASNYFLEAKIGGCFCERLPSGGFAEHGRVIYAEPGKSLQLSTTLGPFRDIPSAGRLSFQLDPADDGGTILTVVYGATGYLPDGFKALAPVVDRVIAEQAERLKQFVETGQSP